MTLRTSVLPLGLATVTVTVVSPAANEVRPAIWPLNMFVAAVCAVALDCCIMLGVSAASTAASAAALSSVRTCAAWVKSIARPMANINTGSASAYIIATLPRRSRRRWRGGSRDMAALTCVDARGRREIGGAADGVGATRKGRARRRTRPRKVGQGAEADPARRRRSA